MSDGHEAEPRVDCTVDTDGRIVLVLRHLTATERPRVLLRLRPKKGGPETDLHHLDTEPGADGRHTAVLPTGTVLTEGRWDLYLLRAPDGERHRLRPGPRDLRALVDGHVRDWPAPVAVRVPYTTKDGFLAVRSWLRTAHAEAAGMTFTGRSATVRARLHGVTADERATVRLRLRGTDVVRTLPVEVDADGRDFRFTAAYGELTAGVWDVSVRPTDDVPPVRIARLLDDVADRKEVFVYPEAVVDGCAVRPYYTVDNDLSLSVTARG
ncbi:transferase [Streptomyces sp. NPDC088387]|uniref:transferase n=1 Tax=Streptomyces sp. NPDC088387 TaxID=3365859 RepID=UPI003827D5B5